MEKNSSLNKSVKPLRPSLLERSNFTQKRNNNEHLHTTQLNNSNIYLNTSYNITDIPNATYRERTLLDANADFVHQHSKMKQKTDLLYTLFLEVLQSRSSESDIFDAIHDLIQTCGGVMDEIKLLAQQQTSDSSRYEKTAAWLEEEWKTWRLLDALYNDRINVQTEIAALDNEMPILGCSENIIVDQVYTYNFTLREYQIIADWLEFCYKQRDCLMVAQTKEPSRAWENTLFELKGYREMVYKSKADIVKSMDPDAPVRERRPLHTLDQEDELRLSKCIFIEIRRARLNEAMSLCKYSGQPWRAAILEGWRFFHDPNYDAAQTDNLRLPIEGNPRRDLWKHCAWRMANSQKYDEYTRAIVGLFSGHLDSLKLVLKDWEDLLWAYIKVQIDIRVESEIRACCTKSYLNMADQYWNQKMSLEQIFEELSVHNDANIRDYAVSKVAIIQKYLILDNIPELLQTMLQWIEDGKNKKDATPLSSQFLRFLTHIVLFMRQIGRVHKEEIADQIIAAYIDCLIELSDANLIAFYTAALPSNMQINLYSKFLQKIDGREQRSIALNAGLSTGLDIENITRHTVETIRKASPENESLQAAVQIGDISAFDRCKIKALEWLTFLPSQRGDLLWETTAMIRTFLAENKIECVRAAYEMVPADSLAELTKMYGSKNNFPCREECCVKECLCYNVYLTAIEHFNEFTQLYYSRPKQPQALSGNTDFTERVAAEHREEIYRDQLNQWKTNVEELSKVTIDSLYNILLFPEKGWLIDPDTDKSPTNIKKNDWENRQIQLEKLRSICIPEIVLLLHNVLHTTGDYKGCIRLADEIASEKRQHYKVYTKHKLAELLTKLAESSQELLNTKLDAWGFPIAT